MQKLHFIQILSEIGAGKLGTKQGVQQLWEKFKSQHPEQATKQYNLSANNPEYREAKHIDILTSFFQQDVVPNVTKWFKSPDFPIILSGDHSNAIGTVSAFCNAYPDKRIGVLWIDAHSDLHTPYTTPSGNLHGMSLAAVSRQDNRQSAIRTPNQAVLDDWQRLKNLAPTSRGICPKDIFFLGLRSYETAEANLIEQFELPHISALETRKLGFAQVLDNVKQRFSDVDLLYVSFDVDALDAKLIPTTGTPEPDGFTYEEIKIIFDTVLRLPQLAVFEVTEFNPTLDSDPIYLEKIYELLEYATKKIQLKV